MQCIIYFVYLHTDYFLFIYLFLERMKTETSNIIIKIADIQITALTNIENNWEEVDKDLLGRYLGISPDLKSSLYDLLSTYEDIKSYPSTIKMLSEEQLMICSHILFRMEDEWMKDNPTGVRETWELLFKQVDRIHPEYNLIWAYGK